MEGFGENGGCGCIENCPLREKKGGETPWMCLPAVLAGFQTGSVTLSISALHRGDNGLSAPYTPPPPSPSTRERWRVREGKRRAGGGVRGDGMQQVIWRHVSNCVAYVYLGYDARQTLNCLSFPSPPPTHPPPLSSLCCSLKLECEKLATEKTEIQRHYVMVRCAHDAPPFFTITTQHGL